MAIGIWITILAALLLATSEVLPNISLMSSFLNNYRYANLTTPVWSVISFVIAALGVLFFILRAWALFFTYSKRLFIALGRALEESETASVFYPLLTFKRQKGNQEDAQPPAGNARGSIISAIAWSIALSFLLVVAEYVILITSSLFIQR
jgi:hypothetical protein